MLSGVGKQQLLKLFEVIWLNQTWKCVPKCVLQLLMEWSSSSKLCLTLVGTLWLSYNFSSLLSINFVYKCCYHGSKPVLFLFSLILFQRHFFSLFLNIIYSSEKSLFTYESSCVAKTPATRKNSNFYKEHFPQRKKERIKKGWCLFSRCALQMRLCILDPVRWIYCLHLLLPEEREGIKGKRGRNGGSTYSSALRLYSPFF